MLSEWKAKFRRHRSRSRSPSHSSQSLANAQASPSVANAAYLSSHSPQVSSIASTADLPGHHSMPIITISEAALPQESDAQNPPIPEFDSQLAPKASNDDEGRIPTETPYDKIWVLAYNDLKSEEPKLVQAYEKILASQLLQNDTTTGAEAVGNGNEQEDKNRRRSQMQQLAKNGLEKISREMKLKSRIGHALPMVHLSRNMVTEAVNGMPQAALPWAAVSLSLELLANPISEMDANRTGISHVVQQMNWYCELAALVFGDQDGSTSRLQEQLQARLIDLYKKLLSFEIKSICSYYRHRGLIFLRDLVKLDDWKGAFKEIQDAEAFFNQQFHAFQSIDLGQDLKQLAVRAKSELEYGRTEKDKKCLRDLYITDPRTDKVRIETTKGGLMQDSWRWILHHSDYHTWLHNDDKRLLWLKGDPGKGKTMLLCGLVDEITKRVAQSGNAISFFFCQATIPTLNNHLAVLRGLIWLLADQQPLLISHVRERHDAIGKDLFDGLNAWYSLKQIFRTVLLDGRLTTTYVIIDGLDECATGLSELLELIKETLPLQKVKWILSSRNWPEIQASLEDTSTSEGVKLSLEVNAAVVAAAVDAYILKKVSEIPLLKEDDKLKEDVFELVRQKANGTFLWVAIVFQQLQRMDADYDERSSVLDHLNGLPKDLTELYDRMLQQIECFDGRKSMLCKIVLGISVLAYQPLRLQELGALAGFGGRLISPSALERLIHNCGSFLTVKDGTVYFIHQSSKEYLTTNDSAQSTLFPNGTDDVHHKMVVHSLEAMDQTLCRDIYKLRENAILVGDITTPEPDPLVSLRYPCSHWLRHLCASIPSVDLSDGKVLEFLKKHVLHWLEVLSVMGNPPGGIPYIINFEHLLKQHAPNSELLELVYDIRRFTQHNSWIINNAPLQIYLSGILFSTKRSILRSLFEEELLSWIELKPNVEDQWSPCLQTIDGSYDDVLALSNKILARVAPGRNLQLWDIFSGKKIWESENSLSAWQLSFTSDSKRVVATYTGGVVAWDVDSGIAHHATWFHGQYPLMSDNGKFVASYLLDNSIQIHYVDTGELYLVEDCRNYIKWYRQLSAISNDAKYLVFGWEDERTVWDVAGHTVNTVVQKFRGYKLRFSKDSKLMAYKSDKIMVWDLSQKRWFRTLSTNGLASHQALESLEFSSDSKLVAGGLEHSIWVWDLATGNLVTRIKNRGMHARNLAWSENFDILASKNDESIQVWDMSTGMTPGPVPGMDAIEELPDAITFTNSYRQAATMSGWSAYVWDLSTGRRARFAGAPHHVRGFQLAFSPDCRLITMKADAQEGPSITRWKFDTERTFSPVLISDKQNVDVGVISNDGIYFATAGEGVTIWNVSTGKATVHFTTHDTVAAMAFSNNAQYIVLLSERRNIDVWDVTTGDRIKHGMGHVCSEERCGICKYPGMTMLAVSNDSKRALLGDLPEHAIWIYNEGQTTIRLSLGKQPFSKPIGARESYIATPGGYIDLNGLQTSYQLLDTYVTLTSEEIRLEGYGLNSDRTWITWNGSNILWLPPTYRPGYGLSTASIFPLGLFIVSHTRHVLIIRFTGPPPM